MINVFRSRFGIVLDVPDQQAAILAARELLDKAHRRREKLGFLPTRLKAVGYELLQTKRVGEFELNTIFRALSDGPGDRLVIHRGDSQPRAEEPA